MEREMIKEMRKAIKNNEIESVKIMILNNEGILDVITPFGTFLHDAAMYGMYDVAKYLIECGIDVNRKGGARDSSALTVAAFKGHRNIVELLFKCGTELDVSSFDRNPLFAAIYNGHFDVVRFLIEHGIDQKVSYIVGDLERVDAYEYARQYGQKEIAEYLKNSMQ